MKRFHKQKYSYRNCVVDLGCNCLEYRNKKISIERRHALCVAYLFNNQVNVVSSNLAGCAISRGLFILGLFAV